MEWWWILGELSLAGMGCLQWGEGRDKRRKRSLGEDWKEERMQEKGVEVLRVMGDVAYAAICGLRSLQIPLALYCSHLQIQHTSGFKYQLKSPILHL